MHFLDVETRCFLHPSLHAFTDGIDTVELIHLYAGGVFCKDILKVSALDAIGHYRCRQRHIGMGQHVFDLPNRSTEANDAYFSLVRDAGGDEMLDCAYVTRNLRGNFVRCPAYLFGAL